MGPRPSLFLSSVQRRDTDGQDALLNSPIRPHPLGSPPERDTPHPGLWGLILCVRAELQGAGYQPAAHQWK